MTNLHRIGSPQGPSANPPGGKLNRLYRLTLAVLALLLASDHSASAEYIPPFDLDAGSDSATLIVGGELDATGVLTVHEVIKGNVQGGGEPPQRLRLEQGEYFFGLLKRAMQTDSPLAQSPLAVVAFLAEGHDQRWPLYLGEAGLVGLAQDHVYNVGGPVFQPGQRVGAYGYVLRPDFTVATFRQALHNALLAVQERDRLLALPRSASRMQRLLNFLSLQKGSYHWWRVAQALHPVGVAEEEVILQALQQSFSGVLSTSDAPSQQPTVLLLNLLGSSAPSARAFTVVSGLIDRARPTQIRYAAIMALASMDRFRAVEQFIPLLSLDDPQLATLVYLVSPISSPEQNGLFNNQAVPALLRLSRALRQEPASARGRLLNAEYAVMGELQNLGHPHLLAELYQWTLGGERWEREQALAALNALTGSHFSLTVTASGQHGSLKQGSLAQWWQRAWPLLQPSYNLQSREGRQRWLAAYSRADAATQRILIRLWFFERAIDETALLQAASRGGGKGDGAIAAKAALSELWQRQRLSASTRHAIVSRFITLQLVQLKDFWVKYRQLEFQIIATRNFPFPRDAWVNSGMCIAVGNEPLRLDATDINGQSSLEGSGPIVLGSRGGGLLEGAPVARALLELREIDYYNPSHPRKVLWSQRWTVAPLRMLLPTAAARP